MIFFPGARGYGQPFDPYQGLQHVGSAAVVPVSARTSLQNARSLSPQRARALSVPVCCRRASGPHGGQQVVPCPQVGVCSSSVSGSVRVPFGRSQTPSLAQHTSTANARQCSPLHLLPQPPECVAPRISPPRLIAASGPALQLPPQRPPRPSVRSSSVRLPLERPRRPDVARSTSARWRLQRHSFGDVPAVRPTAQSSGGSHESDLCAHAGKRDTEQASEQNSARSYDNSPADAMNSEDMEKRVCMASASVAAAALGRPPEEVRGLVQVVSLGTSCATKLSIRRLALDEATLPCDWIRSSMEGLVQWLREDFADFLRIQERYDLTIQDCAMTVHRSHTHSFWHDDVMDAAVQEKLLRRVDRFMGLAADQASQDRPRALLFVRSVASSEELSDVEVLFELLKNRFERLGRRVCLLVIIDGQPFAGPVLHARHLEGVIFWLLPVFKGRLTLDCSAPAPYEEAIAFAVRRILGGPCAQEAKWPQVERAIDIVDKKGALWQLGVRDTDAGLWVGKVGIKGKAEDVLFAAFEGYDSNSTSHDWRPVERQHAFLGA